MTGMAILVTSINDRECQALGNEYAYLICSATSIPPLMLAEGNVGMDSASKMRDMFLGRGGVPTTRGSVRWPGEEC